MTRIIEISMAAAGAAGGFLFGGPQGAAIGAVGGGAIGAIGVTSLRTNGQGPSIYIDKKIRDEMESILHLAISATWALRPHIEAEPYIQRRIVEQLFSSVVETYTEEVTPYVQEMQMHLARVVMAGIKPEDSLRHVKRTYAPRFMRKDDSVSFMIAKHVLQTMAMFGPFSEAKTWYLRWCKEIGIEKYAQATWTEHFGTDEIPSFAEWKDSRRAAAMRSFHEEDVA